ncbi:MAG: sigma-70 family RNA polymerase sigma factor [Sandaracinaceae bacterium]|nr:sigma-70 family RNA polymerase sigma factor [Sandaracinaceae bacterium]
MSAPLTQNEWTEAELLSRMLMRRADAWREFHHRYDRLIYRCIHKVTSRFPGSVTSEDVREIYGMFLLSLNKRDMHKLRTFEPERGNKLSSWIGMLATNCAWDFLRGVARQPQCTSLADAEMVGCDQASPFENLLEKQRWTVVNETLKAFSKKDRVFVHLYYVDGLSPEEIAERMAISVKTVYSKKHKIRCRLQKALEPLGAAVAA